MLQISSGKFYASRNPEQLEVTWHRGVLYTNYHCLRDQITETDVGKLLPAVGSGGLYTFVCEVVERLEKPPGSAMACNIISVGPDAFIEDFAAIISFHLNVICTPDHGLAQRLILAQRPGLGIPALPKAYVSRMFDSDISYKEDELEGLKAFVTNLIGLERKAYERAMRAIHRYVTAMHRLADDLDLTYVLLVASIESLVQGYDAFTTGWHDLSAQKRKPIDDALEGLGEDVVTRVHQAVLKSEHVALKRRFLEFTRHHIEPRFFRDEAKDQLHPAGRTELFEGVKKAYDLRSAYIHALTPLPKNLVVHPAHTDIFLLDSDPHLTFHGLARVARHVIMEFIDQSPKVEREEFVDYVSSYPNIGRYRAAPQCWIGNAENYSHKTARQYLNGFLERLAVCLRDRGQKLGDMQAVLTEIENRVPSLATPEQRMPMLALHRLFQPYLPDEKKAGAAAFLDKYRAEFDVPSIESLIVQCLNGEQTPDWGLEESDRLLREYNVQRFQRNGVNAGSLTGAALILWVAEMHRKAGQDGCVRKCIAYAVEEYPQEKGLYKLEKNLAEGDIPEIRWQDVLLPERARTAPA